MRPLPEAVIERARHHILDTVAAMVSGSQLRPGQMAIGYVASLGGVPEASVVGTQIRTSAVTAAAVAVAVVVVWPAASPCHTRQATRATAANPPTAARRVRWLSV